MCKYFYSRHWPSIIYLILALSIMVQSSEENKVDFVIPAAIKDFVFDLYEAMFRSLRVEELSQLYEVKLKEITDKFFAQTPWPVGASIAVDCQNNEGFLLIYR